MEDTHKKKLKCTIRRPYIIEMEGAIAKIINNIMKNQLKMGEMTTHRETELRLKLKICMGIDLQGNKTQFRMIRLKGRIMIEMDPKILSMNREETIKRRKL